MAEMKLNSQSQTSFGYWSCRLMT